MLFELQIFDKELEDIETIVSDMINAGSRYKNLEQSLNPGFTLVLGTDVSETVLVVLIISTMCAMN